MFFYKDELKNEIGELRWQEIAASNSAEGGGIAELLFLFFFSFLESFAPENFSLQNRLAFLTRGRRRFCEKETRLGGKVILRVRCKSARFHSVSPVAARHSPRIETGTTDSIKTRNEFSNNVGVNSVGSIGDVIYRLLY